MNSNDLLKVYSKQAIQADGDADKMMWKSALFCSRIVGKYDRGAKLGLASDMNRSTDTIEDRAHAYMMFEALCNLDGGKPRRFVFAARRMPYIHISHFRALYDAMITYKLQPERMLNILFDIVQGEGTLSSRDIDKHIRSRYGAERPWTYYTSKVMKDIHNTLQHPELPKEIRDVLVKTYEKLGDDE